MKGFVANIETIALANKHFRQVLYTARHCQLVVMSLPPGQDIGMERHTLDQFFKIENGSGEVRINGRITGIHKGFSIVVPAGAEHNITNTGLDDLKLYTLYAPPNHLDGTCHPTRADAQADHEKFDGKTSESSTT
jgi:mannose-6-phosphate isomerase-like protein (cupin superfamily)